jgi:hypothetical protein
MRILMPAIAALTLGLSFQTASAEVSSAYTDLDSEKDCTVFSEAADGEGDWANLVCNGYRGYPVFIYYGDAREALFYGHPPGGDLAPVWESFDAFNSSGPKIEWRIDDSGGNAIPFATIHRWSVSDPEDAEKKIEVLVVEKVGQPYERDGCVVGYVVATGNLGANEKARRIADGQARDFACGADQPAIDQGTVAVPSFNRVDQ